MGRNTDGVSLSVRDRQWKYVITFEVLKGVVREEVYQLSIDPEEQDELLQGRSILEADLAFGEAFCRTVDEVRAYVNAAIERHDYLENTPYGTGLARTEALRKGRCPTRAH